MQLFKINNFIKENPDKTFPAYKPVSAPYKNEILYRIKKLLSMDNSPVQDIVKKINDLATTIGQIDIENLDFSLVDLLDKYGIRYSKHVYINWYVFDDVDEMSIQALNDYFYDIWYPGPDDIDIFDESFKWILSVQHDGEIRLLRLSGEESDDSIPIKN